MVPAAELVLRRAGARHALEFGFEAFDWGSEYYLQHGRVMPPAALDWLRPLDATLLGARR